MPPQPVLRALRSDLPGARSPRRKALIILGGTLTTPVAGSDQRLLRTGGDMSAVERGAPAVRRVSISQARRL